MTYARFTYRALAVWLLMVALAVPAQAQRSGQTIPELHDVDLEQRLGDTIPLDLVFLDEDGREVRLGDYFDGTRPVLLTMTYHNCPMLCSLILDGLTKTLYDFAWTPGDQYEILSVSFAANETPEDAARQKARYIDLIDRPEAAEGWHFLTGDEESIAALTDAIGFKFKWMPDIQEYAHPAVLTFLSGDGRISRYLFGLEFPQRHVRNALVEASEGKIGTTLDQVILYCFQFDPNANSYVLHAVNLMKLGGLLTVLVIGSFLFIFWRRERRRMGGPAPYEAPALSS